MKEIINNFQVEGSYLTCFRYGEGHINETYLVHMEHPERNYILQKINHFVFKHVDQLMGNYDKITSFMNAIIDKKDVFIKLIRTHNDKAYYFDGTHYYRMITYIDHAIAYQSIPSAKHMYDAGFAFGEFQERLATFDASLLNETIPNFHHTPKRFEKLELAMLQASTIRINNAKDNIMDVLAYKMYANTIQSALDLRLIPIRVTHNDTKMNNILFDETTLKVKCIIDLDTIMPGSMLYDFGDAIRFGCNTVQEDEKNTDLIALNKVYFKAYTEGFLKAVSKHITQYERSLLVDGALIMTLEVAVRFLTDYLENDVYFKTRYNDHNLVRATNQITFFKVLKQHESWMRKIVDEIWENL